MIGHLIWEIASKNLEVNRPFTYSTLLMICDQVPQSQDLTRGVDLQLRSNLEKDFRLCFPSKWSILHQLRQSFSHATMLVSQLAEDEINEDLGWSFVNFQFEEKNWAEEVEKKLGSIIWSHLFKGKQLVGKALREGFFLAIETTPIPDSRKEGFRSEVMQLTPDCLKIAFSGSCCIEPEQFMKSVKFEITISKDHQNWFTRAVHEMTHSERMRLVVFITGLEFFGGSQISIDLLNRADDPCIQSSTCFGQLHLPPYSSYETMVRMINYSTMDTSYGRP